MFYLGNAFYLGNRADGNLWKLPDNLTVGSLDVTPVRVGNFTDYDVSESRAAGAGRFSVAMPTSWVTIRMRLHRLL